MSAVMSYIDDHTHTRLEQDSYFELTGDGTGARSSNTQNSITPVHTENRSQDIDPAMLIASEPVKENDVADNSLVLDEATIRRKSQLIQALGQFKAKNPERMTLPEYIMHAFVMLHTKNENTILTYEIIMDHIKIDEAVYANMLRSYTLTRLEQEDFDIDAVGIFKADFENDQKLALLDKQITWLCECCCTDIEETEDKEVTSHTEKRGHDDVQQDRHMDANKQHKKNDESQQNGPFSFAKLIGVEDLPTDVMYEALRQHGNRLVQRSLYAAPRRLYASPGWTCNQEVATRLNSSAAELKAFAEDIHRYSVDTTADDEYYGEQRRLSVRQSALLRKRYL
ncbi:uncharacterized protein BXIN_2438 [Babesia sp. Xinjiang]|uniref:uncharacterized protein n=1 Tax=Babesia sp. Xinjiang TaxID=462227 RepID=UPI000A22A7C6|nr:uncharacterized protein BXIN_2438 [Babesia sp. Xinjiang]ORM41464.1 hypothetical protein BXIN_2438 [Babesia sp. Xinjiang]